MLSGAVTAVIGLVSYVVVLSLLPSATAHHFDVTGNAVTNGDFSNPASIAYVHGYRLGPAAYCPSESPLRVAINHQWGVLYEYNSNVLGNRSVELYRVATVDARNSFMMSISPGQGGRISMLQLLGNTLVNSTTRVHFALDSLNSTIRDFSSLIIVLGPIWRQTNSTFDNAFVATFRLGGLPNGSGWYDFDFSLPRLMKSITGVDVSGYTFGGPCPSSRGIGIGLTASSAYANGTFYPSPALGLAVTDVAVYDSLSGQDTMFRGRPLNFVLSGTEHGELSDVMTTSYYLDFVLPR